MLTSRSVATLAHVIAKYREQLLRHQTLNEQPFALKHFDDRLEACPDAARGEAVTFAFLHTAGLNPRVLEDSTTGGADFECFASGQNFAVEVTAITAETVAQRSGVPIGPGQGGSYAGQAFVPMIRSRVSSKAGQARTYPGACVLVIASTHSAAGMLFSTAVPHILTGEARISIDLGPVGAFGHAYMSTELQNAAFLRPQAGIVQPFRERYSHLILMAVHGEGSDLWGISHPQPAVLLSASLFSGVPFAALLWPPQSNTLQLQWSKPGPKPFRFRYSEFQ